MPSRMCATDREHLCHDVRTRTRWVAATYTQSHFRDEHVPHMLFNRRTCAFKTVSVAMSHWPPGRWRKDNGRNVFGATAVSKVPEFVTLLVWYTFIGPMVYASHPCAHLRSGPKEQIIFACFIVKNSLWFPHCGPLWQDLERLLSARSACISLCGRLYPEIVAL